MVSITKTFCDICQTECIERFGMVAGQSLKMDSNAEMKLMNFTGHYCEEHFVEITKFIETLNVKESGTADK